MTLISLCSLTASFIIYIPRFFPQGHVTATSQIGTGMGRGVMIVLAAVIVLRTGTAGIAMTTGIDMTTGTVGIAMTTEGAGTTTVEVSASEVLIH